MPSYAATSGPLVLKRPLSISPDLLGWSIASANGPTIGRQSATQLPMMRCDGFGLFERCCAKHCDAVSGHRSVLGKQWTGGEKHATSFQIELTIELSIGLSRFSWSSRGRHQVGRTRCAALDLARRSKLASPECRFLIRCGAAIATVQNPTEGILLSAHLGQFGQLPQRLIRRQLKGKISSCRVKDGLFDGA